MTTRDLIIHDVEQGSPEWHALREGRMTASHAQAIASAGAGLETYVFDMMARAFSSADREFFSNEHTDRGHELEPLARKAYELEYNTEVEEVGFVEVSPYLGFSPDGFVGKDGGIETKCKEDKRFLKHLYYGESEIESAYIWQVQMTLLLSGRKWWDLVFYNPNFKETMIVHRIYPDAAKFAKLEVGFKKGAALIDAIKLKMS